MYVQISDYLLYTSFNISSQSASATSMVSTANHMRQKDTRRENECRCVSVYLRTATPDFRVRWGDTQPCCNSLFLFVRSDVWCTLIWLEVQQDRWWWGVVRGGGWAANEALGSLPALAVSPVGEDVYWGRSLPQASRATRSCPRFRWTWSWKNECWRRARWRTTAGSCTGGKQATFDEWKERLYTIKDSHCGAWIMKVVLITSSYYCTAINFLTLT